MALKKYNEFLDPQSLKVMIGDHSFRLEVCKDHIKGLSGRDHVEFDGMIFELGQSKNAQFHMKDCKFALDIIFCDKASVKKIYHSCEPCMQPKCQKYSCGPADVVIELPAGTCKKNSITEGMLCQFI
jgi:uncharacterized membrane protein (UPF0127 family)